MRQFHVPQRRVPVRIRLEDGRELAGTLYAPAAGPDGAPGRILDRLNDPAERFLPLTAEFEGILVHKAAIVAVRVLEPLQDEAGASGGAEHEVAVRVGLTGGASLLGALRYAMPEGRERPLDYLNSAPTFLPLHSDGELTLVQRDRIVSVHAIDEE